ncbi:TIGR03089 family protein [Jongsikchunia kroppenstedtii]|uniref:TIGR03089 family protein n=1 Tax=Jongsikchunia kroppenstedtii TaxID=1121721 RepID=UPI00037772D9|nr:TIGR03089 family protein [Jongsikchunia kroppenstedtii]
MAATVTDAALAHALGTDPAQPLLTFYDDATGERTELSALTLANWAAKTANMIRDEFGLAAGDVIAVDAPVHWQTAAVLLGSWWAGTEVRIGTNPDAALAFVSQDRIDDAQAPEIAVLSLDPFALGVRDLPVGITDFASTVRIHGDRFAPSDAPGPALAGHSRDETIAAATQAAAGIDPRTRLLSNREWATADEVVANLLAPWIGGASLVQNRNGDPALQEQRRIAEKVTLSWD